MGVESKKHSRLKNQEWNVQVNEDGFPSMDGAALVVMMDIRDELKEMKDILGNMKWDTDKQLRGLRRDVKKLKGE